MVGLFFRRQPLSVRKVRGTCTFHPSANFFRMVSGTRYAALEPVRPSIRAGRLRVGAAGAAGGTGIFGGTIILILHKGTV
jgi:hypothetical protein